MKKIFTILCLCSAVIFLLSACGGSKSKSGSSSLFGGSSEPVCITANENTVLLLTSSTTCDVENTDKGCLITFKTKVGKQSFLIPVQYDLDHYKERYLTANGTFEELQLNAGQLFKKDDGFYMKGNVRPYDGAGMTFRLPNDKMLTIVAPFLYDKKMLDVATVRVRHLPLILTNKKELPIINVNVALASDPDAIISPIFLPLGKEELSTPADVEQLVNDGTIEGARIIHFD